MLIALVVDVPARVVNAVVAGLNQAVFIGWLLSGIASFANWCG
jgi:hypothetical protein